MAKKAKATKQPDLVLDCSLASAWYFKDEADPYADAVAGCFPRAQAVAPRSGEPGAVRDRSVDARTQCLLFSPVAHHAPGLPFIKTRSFIPTAPAAYEAKGFGLESKQTHHLRQLGAAILTHHRVPSH